MSTSQSPNTNLESILSKLEEQLISSSQEPAIAQFRQAVDELRKANRQLRNLLEWASEQHRSEKELIRLYRQVAGWNASDLVESLKKIGLSIKKEQVLKDAFDRQGYRLLELVRAGKRDEVYYAILRIFVSAKKRFPVQVVEVFKPIYSEELFKVFLFSFLSSILGKEQDTEE